MAKSKNKPKAKSTSSASPPASRGPANRGPAPSSYGIRSRAVDRSKKTLQSWRIALQSAESILNPVRQLLYDLYADIVLDEHLTSVLDKRLLALTNTSLVFRRDTDEDDVVGKLIGTEDFEELLGYILDAKFYGYSLTNVECPYNPDDVRMQVELVPRANVVPSLGLVVPDPYVTNTGVNYTVPPFTHNHLACGRKTNLGLLLKAAPLVLLKRGDISDWADFNEVFGQPFRVGYYNSMDPAQKGQMERAMDTAGGLAWLVLPDGSRMEFPNIDRSGAVDTYEKLAHYMDAAMSKLIVGQTMTTSAEGGNYKGEVHERVEERIAAADRRYVLKVLNSELKGIMLAQGWPVGDGEFFFVDEEERIPKDKRLDMDLKIHKDVGRIKKEYFKEEYNVDFVDDTDPKKEEQPDPEQPGRGTPDPTKPGATEPKPGTKQANASPFSLRPWIARLSALDKLTHFFHSAPTH